MKRALQAEWTKLRTVGGTGWLLLAVVGLTVGLSAATVKAATCDGTGCTEDITRLSLTGVYLGQAVVAVIAVLVISGEYSTGMIRTTLTAVPGRTTMLAAKATVLCGVLLVTGAVAVLGSVLAGRLILPGNGFTEAHGFAPLSLADGPTLRAATGSVLYLLLIALFSLGIATAVRDAAAAIGIVLGLLYVFPILIHVVTDPDWQRHLQQLAPMPAGLAIQATTGLHNLPIGPWPGLGVLAGWTAAALLAGWLRLRYADG